MLYTYLVHTYAVILALTLTEELGGGGGGEFEKFGQGVIGLLYWV